MNDNKLIAEFMGHKTDWGFKKDSILYMPQGEGNSTNNSVVIPYKKLQYHTSWDWLMPVVQKVSSLCDEPYELDNMKHALLTGDIESVYDDVVEFIKWYNQNKEDE